MRAKPKTKTSYVDALQNEHLYAVVTKQGRIQILVQPTIKCLRQRGQRGWHLFDTVDNGLPDAASILTATVQRALQEMETTGAPVQSNGKKVRPAKAAVTSNQTGIGHGVR